MRKMNCPVCVKNLTPVKAGGVIVDVCLAGCGGIWFDNFELQKFDDSRESAGELLISVTKGKRAREDATGKRKCPKCEGITMLRHFFSAQRHVEVDECPQCGGYWLDAGELALIRQEYESEQERKKAVDRYFAEVAASQLASMRAGGRDQAERARKLDALFRFSSPIRYQVNPG